MDREKYTKVVQGVSIAYRYTSRRAASYACLAAILLPPLPASAGVSPLALTRRPAILLPAAARGEKIAEDVANWAPGRARRPKATSTEQPRVRLFGKAAPAPPRMRDVVPPDDRTAVATRLLGSALAAVLRQKLSVGSAPEPEVASAAEKLTIRGGYVSAAGCTRLCASVHADLLIMPAVLSLDIEEGVRRTVHLTARAVLMPPDGSLAALGSKRLSAAVVAAAASCGRRLFKSGYKASQGELIRKAAAAAAFLLVHDLLTGATGPLDVPGARLAIAPTTAPASADALVFEPFGRRIESNVLRGLPRDASAGFHPECEPLPEWSVVSPAEVQRILGAGGEQSVWLAGEAPDGHAAAEIGRLADAGYVLVSRVSDLGLDAGPSDPRDTASPDEQAPLEARAEAIGALVRVQDGAILWQARTSARAHLFGHPSRDSARSLALSAERFALAALAHQWLVYNKAYATLSRYGTGSAQDAARRKR